MENQLQKVHDKLDSLIISTTKSTEKITAMEKILDKFEKKFAAKWIEKVVYGMIALSLVTIFTAVLKLVVS